MQYRFHNCVLDLAEFALYRDGDRVDLEPQVFRLLQYLLEHRDRVVPRGEIFDKVFAGRVVTDNALTVRIRAARAAVGDDAKTQQIIETVTGGGYRFVAPAEAVSHVAARSRNDSDRASEDELLLSSGLSAEPTVVVLPFEVLGDDDLHKIIARGLVHDVTTRIARSRTMLVIDRGTAFQFEGKVQSVRELGVTLGVRYVAQGAVQISGHRIRISIGLASTESSTEVGSWQYDRELNDVLHIQDEIAALIVSEMELEVQRQEIKRSSLMPSTNLDAWATYHRGLGHMYRFRTRDCDKAEGFFRRAIDLESKLPRPYAGLSFVSYERAYLNLDGSRTRSLRKAIDYAEEAIALDPTDPMGHWALSRALFLTGDLDEAYREVSVSTDLNPSYATAQYFSGWVAMQLGDHENGLSRIELARALSPHDPLIYGMDGVSALILALLGRNDEAKHRAMRALKHPDVHYQALAFAMVIFSLIEEFELAQEMLKRVQAVKPGYDIKEFFSVYAFQKDEDVQRITSALNDIGRRLRSR